MPVSGGKYVAPAWKDNAPPALDAAELQAMTDAIERTEASIGDVTTPAQKMGLTGELSIGKALGVLADVGNVHVWRRTSVISEEIPAIPAGYTVGEVISGKLYQNVGSTQSAIYVISVSYGDSVTVDMSGNVSIVDPTTKSVRLKESAGKTTLQSLVGKYVEISEVPHPDYVTNALTGVFFIPPTASVSFDSTDSASTTYQMVIGYPYTAAIPPGTHTSFPISTNPNAYQEGSDEKPAGYTLGDTVTGSFALCQTSDSSMSWDYSDNLVVSENGDISMGTTTRLSLSRNNAVSAAEVLKGKFFISRMSGFPGFEDGKIYYMPVDATITKNVALYTNMYQIPVGYPAIPANTTIEYLGSLGDKTRIEMGSYAGTGVFGKSNPNSLTFGFAPKIVIIERDYYFFEISVFIRGVTLSAISTVNASGNDIKLTWTDKAVSWYSNNAGYQLNSTPIESGSYKGKGKYFYIAIG